MQCKINEALQNAQRLSCIQQLRMETADQHCLVNFAFTFGCIIIIHELTKRVSQVTVEVLAQISRACHYLVGAGCGFDSRGQTNTVPIVSKINFPLTIIHTL